MCAAGAVAGDVDEDGLPGEGKGKEIGSRGRHGRGGHVTTQMRWSVATEGVEAVSLFLGMAGGK